MRLKSTAIIVFYYELEIRCIIPSKVGRIQIQKKRKREKREEQYFLTCTVCIYVLYSVYLGVMWSGWMAYLILNVHCTTVEMCIFSLVSTMCRLPAPCTYTECNKTIRYKWVSDRCTPLNSILQNNKIFYIYFRTFTILLINIYTEFVHLTKQTFPFKWYMIASRTRKRKKGFERNV